MQRSGIDPFARLQRIKRDVRLRQDRGISRVGAQLRPDDTTQRPPRHRDQNMAANASPCARRQRNQPALAMAEQPDARCASGRPRRRCPCACISSIIGDRHGIRISNRALAGEQTPLVHPHACHPPRGQRRRQLGIGRAAHPQRVIAIAIGRARAGKDDDNGRRD